MKDMKVYGSYFIINGICFLFHCSHEILTFLQNFLFELEIFPGELIHLLHSFPVEVDLLF